MAFTTPTWQNFFQWISCREHSNIKQEFISTPLIFLKASSDIISLIQLGQHEPYLNPRFRLCVATFLNSDMQESLK